jgi:23S rRNA U2552 (ribose-2'-O)-methylase RlmE/FtsJ
VVHAAGPELLADFLCSGQSKIRDRKPQASIEAKHILRLEVTMIDAQRMAKIDRVEELEENVLDQVVVTKIASFVENLAKEITVGAVVHDYERAVFLLDYAMKRDDVWVD